MKNIISRYLSITLLLMLTLTSCLVSKKKYDALAHQRQKSMDSLNAILANNITDFNSNTTVLNQSNAIKDGVIDSLTTEVKKLAANASELKQSLSDAIVEYKQEKDKLLVISSQLDSKSKMIDSLTKVLAEKQARLFQLEEMIAKNKEEVEKLKNTVSNALNSFDKTDLTVYQKNGKVYVALEEKLLFQSGSATVDKKGEDALKKIAGVLEKTEGIDIVIEGHTDNVGSAKLNWELSTKRATAIVNMLQENSKIDPKRFTAAGHGMYQPLADNETKEGKAKNRRIDIVLSPKLDQLYKILDEK